MRIKNLTPVICAENKNEIPFIKTSNLNEELLLTEVKNYLALRKIFPKSLESQRATPTVNLLKGFSSKSGHSLQFLIYSYAHYYVERCCRENFNQLYLRCQEFFDLLSSSTYYHPIKDEDIPLALNLREVWKNMDYYDLSNLPLTARKLFSQKNIIPGATVSFSPSVSFPFFVVISSFIERNRRFYPQLHGYEEFFMHLPAVRGAGNYALEYYVDVKGTVEESLERYYAEMYGSINKEDRFNSLVSTIPLQREQVNVFKTSNLWAAKEIGEALQLKLNQNQIVI